MSRVSNTKIISASALITGNIIGAGILGLPIATGLAGFLPAMAAMVFTWGLMLATPSFCPVMSFLPRTNISIYRPFTPRLSAARAAGRRFWPTC